MLIIDLDGVIRRWEPVAPIEARHGLPEGALFGTAFAPDVLDPAITGEIDDARWRAEITARLTAEHGPAARLVVEEWSRASGTVDHAVLELVRHHRRTSPVALLSNATSRLPDDLARLNLTPEFDRVFGSYQLGVAKPDPRVFTRVCAELGASPAACHFVDDTAGHAEAAERAGLRAHHFRGPEGLALFLASV